MTTARQAYAIDGALNAAMDRYANGDDAAFAAVYDALAPRVLGFVRRRVSDEGSVEELVQQTFLQMHLARERYVTGLDVVPWALAIARRLLIDAHRRARHDYVGDDIDRLACEDALQDETLEHRRTAQALRRTLRELPPKQREAFELVKGEGLSLASAASVLGTTETAVKLRVHRAVDALRRLASRCETDEQEKGARGSTASL
jgi:RNA polymerase sigma-70 factor (ECF subfamily)